MESLSTAFAMFRAHKVRFLLTISGIVVGVASLVTLASFLHVGERLLRDASSQATGDDIVSISNDWREMERYPEERRLRAPDQRALERSSVLGETTFTAVYGIQHKKLKRGEDMQDALIAGVTETAFDVFRLRIEAGRGFGESDYAGTFPVAIVGSEIMDEHSGISPGETLRVDGKPFTIVGVLARKPEMGHGDWWGWNNRVLIPARVFNLEFNIQRRPSSIVARVRPPDVYEGLLRDYVIGARELMRRILMEDRKHQTFKFEGVSESADTERKVLGAIKALTLLTTIFSMLVGGINVMNIMLVTVTERTREIGIRRALGASRGDILRQFLSETLAVTFVGASLGVVLALGLLGGASVLLTKHVAPWPFYVSPWAVGGALGGSSAIAVVFGLLPARHAARLDPVEALRHE